MKKIIVTGATGFIGRHALPLLKQAGYEIHAIIPYQIPNLDPDVAWYCLDLLNSDKLFAVLKEIASTDLLHLAWYAVPGKFWTSAENLCWVEASLKLVRAFKEAGGQKIVAAGTCAEYDWNYALLSEKNTPFNPNTLYGASKRALSLILTKYCEQMGLDFSWGYIFYLFGSHEYPDRFIPQVIRALLENRELPCSHGNQKRDFLHVVDVASAFVSLLESSSQGSFNIGSGRGISLKEVACKIALKMEKPHLLQFNAIKALVNDPPELVADISHISQEIGWRPQIDLQD